MFYFSSSQSSVNLNDYPNATKVKLYAAKASWPGWTCGGNSGTCDNYTSGGSTGYGSITVVCYGLKGPQFGTIPGGNLTTSLPKSVVDSDAKI